MTERTDASALAEALGLLTAMHADDRRLDVPAMIEDALTRVSAPALVGALCVLGVALGGLAAKAGRNDFDDLLQKAGRSIARRQS